MMDTLPAGTLPPGNFSDFSAAQYSAWYQGLANDTEKQLQARGIDDCRVEDEMNKVNGSLSRGTLKGSCAWVKVNLLSCVQPAQLVSCQSSSGLYGGLLGMELQATISGWWVSLAWWDMEQGRPGLCWALSVVLLSALLSC